MLRNLLFFFAAVFLLTSCGEDSKHFKIEGRLLQMNQGEFYIYSNDAAISGIDTIKVQEAVSPMRYLVRLPPY